MIFIYGKYIVDEKPGVQAHNAKIIIILFLVLSDNNRGSSSTAGCSNNLDFIPFFIRCIFESIIYNIDIIK